ncbi:AMP-dependent synthetase [Mycobacteriaceae bacterium 1482268.1]|nr:AMP-dependent synthetase [Mycobacteriaceae bacterium 1482268.1]
MTESVPTLGAKVSILAAEKPDAPAVTCSGRTLTREELDSSTNRLARAFAERGVGTGDYVTIAVPNSIEFLQAAIAAWKLGAVPQPLPARLPDNEFRALLELRPRALIVGRADPSGTVPSVEAGFTPDPAVSDAALPEAVSPTWKAMASGGSTGRPKLIEAGGDSRTDLAPTGLAMGTKSEDVQLVSVPMSHNTGMTTATMGLAMGHHIVLMPRFDPEEFLRLIADTRVNWLATVPTIMHRLLPVYDADPDAYDLSSLRRLWHVGAPCAPSVKERWIELLGPDVVWELYGGTELQALAALSGGEWLQHRGSVGRVISGEMKVLDDDGNECPPGVNGEIYMRPTPGTPATYRYIGATAKSRDGWDSLGDLGYFDEDGYLYLNDRRVDMFTVGGRNVYPAEVEGALCAHPEVLSCLVVGVPDEDMGQVPYALVQAENLEQAELIEFLAERIASYKVPRTVEFVDEPLRDDAGKARRSAVRDDVIARLGRARA